MNIIDVFQFIVSILNNQNLMIKSILLVFVSMYSLFSLTMLRQIFLLSEIVSNISSSLKILSFINVFTAAGILLVTIVTL